MNRSALVWALAVVALTASPLDDWLDARQPRLLLVQIPAWLALGWLAGRRFRGRPQALDPHGLTGLACFVAALGFWMIPRSMDLINTSESADQWMHATLLAGGLALSAGIDRMPFVARIAAAIYGTSMIFALGMTYSHYTELLCGSFDLTQQHETGRRLLVLTPVALVFTVVVAARALGRESRGGGEQMEPERRHGLVNHIAAPGRAARQSSTSAPKSATPSASPTKTKSAISARKPL